MFNFTLPELVVIFVVALIVFGPKRLPELGRRLGKAVGDLQRALQGVREQMDVEKDSVTHMHSGQDSAEKDKPGHTSEHKEMEGVSGKSHNDER
jgi:sec-independent protein translocase protein TatA